MSPKPGVSTTFKRKCSTWLSKYRVPSVLFQKNDPAIAWTYFSRGFKLLVAYDYPRASLKTLLSHRFHCFARCLRWFHVAGTERAFCRLKWSEHSITQVWFSDACCSDKQNCWYIWIDLHRFQLFGKLIVTPVFRCCNIVYDKIMILTGFLIWCGFMPYPANLSNICFNDKPYLSQVGRICS